MLRQLRNKGCPSNKVIGTNEDETHQCCRGLPLALGCLCAVWAIGFQKVTIGLDRFGDEVINGGSEYPASLFIVGVQQFCIAPAF